MSSPALSTVVRQGLREAAVLPGAHVVVATSGGPDSMALLDVLSRLGDELRISAVGVDHGLRAEAAGELSRARAYAETRGIQLHTIAVAVSAGSNLQARARTLRYQVLRAECTRIGADCIATAHHAEDRAETVLLRILRGAPFAGLGVLPARSADLVRPMLRATRAMIDAHVARYAIPVSLDPSNHNRRFVRTRLRQEVLPLLRSLDPQITRHLCALADEAQRGSSGLTRSALAEAELAKLPQRTQAQIAEAVAKRATNARIWLPKGRVLRVGGSGELIIEAAPPGGSRRSKPPQAG